MIKRKINLFNFQINWYFLLLFKLYQPPVSLHPLLYQISLFRICSGVYFPGSRTDLLGRGRRCDFRLSLERHACSDVVLSFVQLRGVQVKGAVR